MPDQYAAPVPPPITQPVVATPPAQPTQPAPAPAPQPVATPVATPVAAAKDNVQQMATPEPLPAKAPAPAPSGSTSGGSGTTAPAPAMGPGAQAAAAAKSAADTKAAQPKTAAKASLDALAPVNDTIKKLMSGDDPIAKIQTNQIINGTGPRNQAVLQGLGMKLAQANLDGQGAGSAMLAMLARDNEFDIDQLTAKVAEGSASRLLDMNKWGFEQAQQISQAEETQKRADLSKFISTGQVEAARGAFESLFPGVPFDAQAIKAADPTRTAAFTSRMKVVDQFVSQGNAEQAQASFMQLANDMPEMFGFSDSATAQAALAGVNFTSEAWQNNLNASNTASTAARTAALQGDDAAVSAAIDQKFSKMTPAAIEAIGSSTANRSLEEINAILKDAGMASIATTDEAKMLDKVSLAKAAAAYDIKKDAVKEAPDRLFDIFAKANPAMAIDPEASQYARAYLSSAAYQLATSADGSVSLGSFDANGQVPPWDPTSPQAPLFMDWPHATFNSDGTMAERIYDGLRPYDDTYKPGDLTNAKGAEDARLDKAYKDYSFSTPAADHLDMEKWYYATAGGTKPVDQAKVPGSIAVTKAATASDTTDPTTGVRTVTAPDPVTGEMKTETTQPKSLSQEISNIGGNGGSFQSWLTDNPSGIVSIPGGGVAKVTGIKDTGSTRYGRAISLQVNGWDVLYNSERGVFLAVPKGSHLGRPDNQTGYAEFKTAAEAINASGG